MCKISLNLSHLHHFNQALVFPYRSAKEDILGLSRTSSPGNAEKTEKFTEGPHLEETLIAEYALVITGHSLVRLKCVTFPGIFLYSAFSLTFISTMCVSLMPLQGITGR